MDMSFGMMTNFTVVHGLARTPGSKYDQIRNDQVISRKWAPSPRPPSDASVSIINGLFRFDGEGDFIAGPEVWGDSRYIETLVMSHATEYETATSAIQFIGGVEYTFTATTMVDPVIPDGEAVLFGGDSAIFGGEDAIW